MDIKNKKAQSETVGFVFIILIVMVVGVIFLGISLRNKDKQVVVIDAELSNFLSSSLDYTTDCYKDHDGDFKSLGDIISYCYLKTEITCPNGKKICEVMNETYSDMLLKFRPAGTISYSKLELVYKDEVAENNFFTIIIGNSTRCGSKRGGESFINQGSGDIVVKMEICPSMIS